MATAKVRYGKGGYFVDLDPDPAVVAKQIARHINKPMAGLVGKLHKKLGDVPIDEIKSRSNAKGSGYVHIGESVRPSATKRDLVISGGGAKTPDFAGWEFGSYAYRQFDPWTGNGDDAGYVIGDLMRDEAWMTKFGERYEEAFVDLLETVWNGRR